MGDGISINVGIKNAAVTAGLEEMRRGVKEFKHELSHMFSGLVGFAALEQAVHGTINFAHQVESLSERFGVGTATIQRFGHAAEQNGSSLEAMASAFNKLAISQSKALGGDEEMISHFQKLGVTFADLRSLSPEELMLKIGAGSLNAADHVAVLGKNALETRNALAALADGSAELGTVMDEKTVAGLSSAEKKAKSLSNTLWAYLGAGIVALALSLQAGYVVISSGFEAMCVSITSYAKAMSLAVRGHFSEARTELKAMHAEIDSINEIQKQKLAEINAGLMEGKHRHFGTEEEEDTPEGRAQKKRDDHIARIQEAEEAAARAALEGQEKINAMIEERDRLLKEANDDANEASGKDLEALEKAFKLNHDIEAEKKKQADDEAKRQKQIAEAREEEAKAKREYDRTLMDPKDKVKSLQQDKDKLLKDAEGWKAAILPRPPRNAVKRSPCSARSTRNTRRWRTTPRARPRKPRMSTSRILINRRSASATRRRTFRSTPSRPWAAAATGTTAHTPASPPRIPPCVSARCRRRSSG
jgi:hypothetical protein